MMGIGYFLFLFADLGSILLGSVFGGCASVCVFVCPFCAKMGTCMLASVLKCVELNQCLFIYFGILIL